MDFLRILEISALITTIVGLYRLGEKDRYGFLIFDISLCCQFFIFYKNNQWFLCFQMIVLLVFNTYNYFKWGEQRQ
jgi:hypothetical protein